MADKSHWEHVYQTKSERQVSWYQEHPDVSLRFIRETGVNPSARIIDVGGGASTLVDDLLDAGWENVSVLDISATALQRARDRLGDRGERVTWIEADITRAELPPDAYDVWHDRAVFHFLTNLEDRRRYVETVVRSVKAGGHVIVASFGLGGPERCSGLEVVRYSPDSMHAEFGREFALVDSESELHHTPMGTDQAFVYCYCRRRMAEESR